MLLYPKKIVMKKILILSFILLSTGLFAQSVVGINTDAPHASTVLHVESKTKGVLIPRIPNPITIKNPEEGMMIYNPNEKCLQIYLDIDGVKSWKCIYAKLEK